ncbi:MAG TPA: hypothetical protein RMH85_05525 [Polyangiaceae bacterium LLY-WYZ-15_(1-7)]|nr:hypothetical protein [Myxococcales bacterium]MAT27593.1 hypothetical protein [Sandaracinus sp.]HJK89623.1 hypothetical protein [Polyangiaceae bacterium LLY-WYZ-15_(1-7)]HJL05316.1 hypothetical protein [Polyangiaceae bacterium LLY-WYZ-15_(1-7)]HJL07934.1 hypothetical protein [Polyangiaceae bacterium LLY-WYZ-15_(1-7)]
MPGPRHVFVQRFQHQPKTGWIAREERRVDQQDRSAVRLRPPVTRPGLLRHVKRFLGALLRVFAHLLWLSPLAIVAYGVLPGRLAAGVLVAFVCAVVAFFALLNLYILVAGIHYLRGRREVPLDPHDAAPDLLLPDARPALVGRLRSIESAEMDGRPLLESAWGADGPTRVVAGDDLALVPEEGGAPILLRFESAPFLAAPTVQTRADVLPEPARRLAGWSGGRDVAVATLRAGDRIAVYASGAPGDAGPLSTLELGGRSRRWATEKGADPYRGASARARLLTSTAHARLVLAPA